MLIDSAPSNCEPVLEHEKWALDILDKQYRLYVWNDTKMLALITINGLLFAAVGFLYNDRISDTLMLIFISLAVLFISSSLFFCLWHAIPILRGGKAGIGPNRRSLYGITTYYKTWNEYQDAFECLDRKGFLQDTIRQIYGMANNNVRSEKLLRKAARFAYVSAILFLGGMVASALSARDIHLLGQWPVSKSPTEKSSLSTPIPGLSDKRNTSAGISIDSSLKKE